MHQLLQLRSTVQAASGHPCTVETFLGGGGQGEVYRALLDGKPLALKWYFPEQATPAQRQNLETLIRTQLSDKLQIVTPADTAQRGCQLSLRVIAGRERGRALFEHLGTQGVLGDWREPDVIRISPAPLYNTFADVARFALAVQEWHA